MIQIIIIIIIIMIMIVIIMMMMMNFVKLSTFFIQSPLKSFSK